MKIICGIDPGLDGGIAFLDEGGILVAVDVMPAVGEGRRGLDLTRVARHLELWSPDLTVIEAQQAYPKQGVSSSFRTGLGAGQLEGLLIGMGLQHRILRPREWQTVLAGTAGATPKDRAARAARGIWPAQDWRATPKCRRVHDGMIDAALLAEYGRRWLALEGKRVPQDVPDGLR